MKTEGKRKQRSSDFRKWYSLEQREYAESRVGVTSVRYNQFIGDISNISHTSANITSNTLSRYLPLHVFPVA